MDLKLDYYLKYKVTHSSSATLADNITKMCLSIFDIPWEMNFASYEDYRQFLSVYKDNILFEIDVTVLELNLVFNGDPTLWGNKEDAFSKLLYSLRREFFRGPLKCEYILLVYSAKMLYYATMYYKLGLTKAPVMAFIEVYRICCDCFGKLNF